MAEPLESDGPFHTGGWMKSWETAATLQGGEYIVRLVIGERELDETIVEGQRDRRDEEE